MDAELLTTLTRLISPILSSPEAMRSLSALFSGGEGEAAAAEPEREALPEGETVEAAAAPSEIDRSRRREQLLHALRPYLSPAKGERLEGLVRASAMLELLGGTRKV